MSKAKPIAAMMQISHCVEFKRAAGAGEVDIGAKRSEGDGRRKGGKNRITMLVQAAQRHKEPDVL